MELKGYQIAALDAFARWRDTLDTERAKADISIAALESVGADIPPEVRDYPLNAWRTLAASGGVAPTAGPYATRTDDAKRPIPHVCFKVPTGGGKTLLAAAALERLNRQTGLTLWIMPTRAIYEQTRATLRNREHPYRQMLERASGGRVRILEKDDEFTRADTVNYLCVMLLMLPAANRRRDEEFLRMNRDSGRYPTFFPDSDDALGDATLLNMHPDLQRRGEDGPVRRSLTNVFKMLRPVVVLDEAHKAYGARREANDQFVKSVNRLAPSMVIELSATPNRGISNLLVDITGVELKQEEMIKLPVQVKASTNTDWQNTLAKAHEELERLTIEGELLERSGGRYIRPIAVVRVERTGKGQRDGEHVHAEDVRDHLLKLGVPGEEVAVKSSEVDELRGVDLLSSETRVRWVITRDALKEGWDCPFAYLLVMLDNTQAQRALTQLVGRVMRQPHTQRTGREALDQCYVHCCNIDVSIAVGHVKSGLEQEGLTGLEDDVISGLREVRLIPLHRREQFRNKDIFLPLVLHKDGDSWRELDYQRHILPGVNWEAIDAPDPQDSFSKPASTQTAIVDVGEGLPVFQSPQELYIDKSVQVAWYARRLADVVPNPWQAGRIVGQLVERLRAVGRTDADIHDRRSDLATMLREHVLREVEKQSEGVFKAKVRAGEIRCDLEAGELNFRVKKTYTIPVKGDADGLIRNDYQPMQISLFEPVLKNQFDTDLERNFARYLDEHKALRWWHRIAVRQQGDYYLRGWKQDRIWPDFVAMAGNSHVLVFETKGEHLRGNPDTDYKQRVLETLERALNCGTMTVRSGPAKGTFRLVFNEADFPKALANVESSGA